MWHGYGYLTRGKDRIEIWNNERVLAYLAGDPLGTGFLGLKHRTTRIERDCGCTSLSPLYCDVPEAGLPYIDPASDPAPWYDPDVPESAEFAGLFVERVDGFDATTSRVVTDAAILGGSLGPLRLGARTLTVTGWLRSKTCCAAEYGLRWLTEALTGGTCDNCSLGELTMFRCCAPEGELYYLQSVNPQFQFNPTLDGTLTVTDLGGGIYQMDWDDPDRLGWVSSPTGAVNNANGYLPTALDGTDPSAIATLTVGPQPSGPPYPWQIPYAALTGPVVTSPSGTGRSATLTIDTATPLGTDVENDVLTALAGWLASWVAAEGDGVTVPVDPYSNGHTFTLGVGPDPADYERYLLRLGLVDGPTVTERAGTCCDSCGCTDLRVQFTLASESPFIFGPTEWCLFQQPWFTGESYCLDLYCNECPEDAQDPVLATECVSESNVTPPAVFQPIDPCYCDPWVQYRMCCELENPGDWNEATTVIEVFAGQRRLKNMKIQAFLKPFDETPCPCDPTDLFWKCRDACSIIEIGELPSGSLLSIDARSRVSTLTLPGGRTVGGTRFFTGPAGIPFEWFDLSACSSLCILATVDANNVASNAWVSIGAAARFQASGG